MYVPKHFALTDEPAVAELLAAHSFATLVTHGPEGLQASHVPLLYEGGGRDARLLGHIARANPQRHALARLAGEGGEAMAVFQGPHAYVSPSWYGPGAAVPTWNYLAVHIYATPAPIEDPAAVRALLARLVDRHESHRPQPWSMDSQAESFLTAMIRGIYAFELRITRIDAKATLNQNRTEAQRAGVQAALSSAPDAESRTLATWMERLTGRG